MMRIFAITFPNLCSFPATGPFRLGLGSVSPTQGEIHGRASRYPIRIGTFLVPGYWKQNRNSGATQLLLCRGETLHGVALDIKTASQQCNSLAHAGKAERVPP